MNKDTLRTQFDAIKNDVQLLKAEGKLSSEALALMQSMILLFEIMVSVFLEKTVKKNTKNSSIPSSQVEKDNSAINPGSKAKGRDGHGRASNFREIITEEIRPVEDCSICGADLSDMPVDTIETRTLIDIIFEKHVHHVSAEIKQCHQCEAVNKGVFPKNMAGPLQYGNGLKSYILNLIVAQMVPLKRCQQMIKAMIGQVLSESTLLGYMTKLSSVLEEWERMAIEVLLSRPSLHVDETSMRVNRKKQWVHVYTAGDITVKYLHMKRGKEAIEDNNVIPRYGGIIVHDCWASYLSYEHCGHGLCGAHLTRELTFIVESNGYRWAANMKKLLLETCKLVSQRKRKKLTTTEYANLQKRYRNILTRGEGELPEAPARVDGQKGRIGKSDAHNLLERLKKYESAVLIFAKEAYVPFTNNQAERELRMGKVKQKVSGCFRDEKYAQAYCRISSYLQTMSAQGYNPLVAIQLALTGELYEVWGE
jgi:transposase